MGVTKLVLNSGKSSLMNTVLTLPEPNAVIPTCNSNVSTFNTTKQLVDVKSLVQYSWILNLEPWTPSAQDHSANSSDLTISYSARLEQVTTGLKVTTPKVQIDRLRPRRRQKGSRGMRLPPRFPNYPLPRRRNRFRYGYAFDLQDPRRIS